MAKARKWGHLTPELRETVANMLRNKANGVTYTRIARMARCCRTTVAKIAREEHLELETAQVLAGQRRRMLLNQARTAKQKAASSDPDVNRCREERERRVDSGRLNPILAEAKREFDARLEAQRAAGKTGRPKGPQVIVDDRLVPRPEPTERQRILYAIDMWDLRVAGFRYTDMEK